MVTLVALVAGAATTAGLAVLAMASFSGYQISPLYVGVVATICASIIGFTTMVSAVANYYGKGGDGN